MFEQSQIQEFKEAFGCIDQDRDGVIKKQDLKETYAQLGKLNIKDEELEEMLNEGKGPINFTVFLTLFGEKLNGTDPEDTILAAFKPFDPNGTGFVNKDEHEGKTSPWLSEQSPLDLHGPAPPESHKLHCQNSHFKNYRRLPVINVEIC
uniref:Myosin light chain 7 n=1 Tax=Xiphophorus couchianus TaxID=32473 RepID=A0A3B5LJX8_9TELE